MSTATTTMKKLLNDPADVVRESLAGLAAAHGDILRYDAEARILVRTVPRCRARSRCLRRRLRPRAAARRLRRLGMLDALPGEVFTSPVPEQMLAATKAVDGGAGVVHIVKNYTGDVRLQARGRGRGGRGHRRRVGARRRRCRRAGLALHRGRRGGGAVLVEKIAGAAPSAATTWRGRGRRAARQRARALVRRGAVVLHAAGGGPADLRPPDGEVEVGSASTASRAAPRGARPAQGAAVMVEAVLRPAAVLGRARAAVRQRHGRHARLELYLLYHEVDELLRGGPGAESAAWSAATSPRSRWPARR